MCQNTRMMESWSCGNFHSFLLGATINLIDFDNEGGENTLVFGLISGALSATSKANHYYFTYAIVGSCFSMLVKRAIHGYTRSRRRR